MLSIAILDDNIKLLENYEQLIPDWFDKYNIKGRIVIATTDYKVFLREVRDQLANVCIIDINLQSEVNGIYIAKCLRREKIKAEIIFCTGMLEFIQQAFDVNAYQFITKPVGRNLEKCLVKLNKEIKEREDNKCIIEIKSGFRIFYIPMGFISHICREGNKSTIYTNNRIIEVYDSLESLISQLNDLRFIRCHRAVIINKEYLDYIDKKNKNLVLTNGFKCKLGSTFNHLIEPLSIMKGSNTL
ncbi:MAG: response regulator transcription factor [Clostridiaceae bacterium]|jgi:DNA-binding LytR/AlgR family response regulator|nr:response regulator transcription factor [Clostridiaceae bacterium]